MFEIIILFALILCGFAASKIHHGFSNPTAFYCFFWGTVILLYSLKLYGFHTASDETLLLILLGMLNFVFGAESSFLVTTNKGSKSNHTTFGINKKKLTILFVSAIIIYSIRAGRTFQLVRGGLSVNEVRYTEETSSVLRTLLMFYAVPITVAFMCVMFANLIRGEVDKIITIETVSLILGDLVYRFSTLEAYLMCFGVVLLIFVQLSKTRILKNEIRKKLKRNIIRITPLGIGVLFLLSTLREWNFIEHVYTYICCGLLVFSVKLQKFQNLGRNSFLGQYTYGMASFQGLIRPFINILERLGFESKLFNSASDFYWPWMGIPVVISSSKQANSFSTPFMYFYKDGGVLGVIAFSFIYGFICGKTYKNAFKSMSTYSLSVYVFIVFSMAMTLMEAPFVKYEFSIAIYMLCFLKQKQDVKRGGEMI